MTKSKSTQSNDNPKKLQWRDIDGNLTLFLSTEGGKYVPYTDHPLQQTDYLSPNIKLSRGWRTAQVALDAGYKYDQDVDPNALSDVTTKTAAQRVADQILTADAGALANE